MAGTETAKNKQKAAKVTKDKMLKVTKDKANDKLEKKPAFVWTDDETELLLKVTLEYKVSKAASCIDWEFVVSYHFFLCLLVTRLLPDDYLK